jgi:myo-inositol-1(or 4)-monophosphatase
VAARSLLAEALVATGMPFKGHGDDAGYLKELATIMPQVAGVRRFGAAALDLAWVAAGRFDAFWERNLSPWDIAAGALLVREAGGYISDFRGKEGFIESGEVAAGNESMHRQLLGLLNG